MDSYKRGNENLRNPKKESRVLPSGEHFVLTSLLKPWHFSTKFLTYIWQLLSYMQCSYLVKFNTGICTLKHYLPDINQCHTNITPPLRGCKNTNISSNLWSELVVTGKKYLPLRPVSDHAGLWKVRVSLEAFFCKESVFYGLKRLM